MTFTFDDIYKLVSTLALIVTTYLLFRKSKPDTEMTVSTAVKNLAEALNLSSTELTENIAEAAKLRAEIEVEAEATKKRRKEADEKVEELTKQIAALRAESEKEAQRLRSENANLNKHMIELEAKYGEINEKYGKAKSVIGKVVKALQDRNIPLPDLNGDLSDSLKLEAIDIKKP